MIKLAITDLDGTFLKSDSTFDRDLYKKVKLLMDQKGVKFAPCTGKQCERVEELFGPELASDLWILGDSATRIKYQGEFVYQSLLPNQLGLRIIQQLEKISLEYTIIACTPSAAIIKETTTATDKQMVRGSYTTVETVKNLQEIREDFIKITVFDAQGKCFEHVQQLDGFQEDAYIVASEASWIDISNVGVHKGTTVEQLQQLLAVSKEETMVFGDGLNDLELMPMGEYSFAMRNGFDQTKAAANFIAPSNDENGVLTTIERLLRLQANVK